MRLGVLLMPTDPWVDAIDRVRHLEDLGFDHLWIYDHFFWQRYQHRPWFGTYTWLAGAAATTSRIRLGTMVANPNIRHPLALAKDAVTIDHISGGRFTLGIGAGGIGFDATVLGQPPLTPGQRVSRLAEYVDVLDRLLSGRQLAHRGEWFDIDDARVYPDCVQQPRLPLAVAAGQQRALDIVARTADAWITYGDTTGSDRSEEGTWSVVREQCSMLERACLRAGRDSGEIQRIYLIGNTEARPLESVEAFEVFVQRCRALGFTDVVFHDPRPDDPVWDAPAGIVDDIAARMLSRR